MSKLYEDLVANGKVVAFNEAVYIYISRSWPLVVNNIGIIEKVFLQTIRVSVRPLGRTYRRRNMLSVFFRAILNE